MARSDYFIKLGEDTLPYKFMKYDSYKNTLNTGDVYSYRNANYILVKNTVATKVKVEFETPYLYENQKNELMAFIRSHYINALERSLMVTAYVDELDSYQTFKAYLVDPEFKIQQNSELGYIYQPIRICFVEF